MRHIKEIMIVAVCLMVLSFCVCTGLGIYFMYREGVQEYEDLRTYVKETDEDDHTEGTDGSDGKQTVVDFRALKKINPDIVAWIRIPDTSIDYPVVQGNDDSYYLTHTFKKAEHVAGAIFLDSDNNADFSDDKNIIYGHNMKDGSMFRGLRNFLDDEFLKEHHILYLYLPDEGVWIFVIVKCEYTPADGDAFLLGTQEEVPTLLLSTCGTDTSKRLVVWCERQEENGEQIEYSDEETEVQEAIKEALIGCVAVAILFAVRRFLFVPILDNPDEQERKLEKDQYIKERIADAIAAYKKEIGATSLRERAESSVNTAAADPLNEKEGSE